MTLPYIAEQTWIVKERFNVTHADKGILSLRREGEDITLYKGEDLTIMIAITIVSKNGKLSDSSITVGGVELLRS